MRKDIREYYSALNLTPGATPLQIKRAYRQLMRRWHPDLFKPGSVMQTTAEDIAKEANEAFDQLIRKGLYRRFPPKEETAAGTAGSEGKPSEEEPEEKPAKAKPAAPPKAPRRPKARASAKKPPRPRTGLGWTVARKMRRWPWKTALAVAAVVAAGFGIWREVPAAIASPQAVASGVPPPARPAVKAPPRIVSAISAAPDRHRVEESAAPVRPGPATSAFPSGEARAASHAFPEATIFHSAASPAAVSAFNPVVASRLVEDAEAYLETFAEGDPKSRVVAVQGEPDEAKDTVYRYGSSLVYFKDGVVSGWSDRQPKLHIRRWPSLDLVSLDTFAVGSTRSDVIRAQGLPSAFSANGYRYGSSMIYFHDDIVTNWVEGDTGLRTFTMPRLSDADIDALMAPLSELRAKAAKH